MSSGSAIISSSVMTCTVDTESMTRLARWTSAALMALVASGW